LTLDAKLIVPNRIASAVDEKTYALYGLRPIAITIQLIGRVVGVSGYIGSDTSSGQNSFQFTINQLSKSFVSLRRYDASNERARD